MKKLFRYFLGVIGLIMSLQATAAADLEVNTPSVNAIKKSMQARHSQLSGYYASGAVGIAADGMIAVRDASAVPLASRQKVNALVAAENQDRSALYAEIANANGRPEWQADIRKTFSQRWVQRAKSGWWVQSGGSWVRK